MKYLQKTKYITLDILAVIVFTLLSLVGFTLVTSNSNLIPGFKSFVVLSGSMQPLIPTGGIVYSLKSENYQKGDVISYKKGKQIVTHRIVEVQDENGNVISPLVSPLEVEGNYKSIFFKTKGDANNAIDSDLVPQNQVIGRALFHFPYAGRLVMFLKSIQGFLFAVILPTFIFILFELFKIKKEIVKNTEKKFLEKMRRYEVNSQGY